MDLKTLRTLLIDGDGVLWRGDQPMPELNRFMDVLAARGIAWGLLTNNATRTVDDYLNKLSGFGIDARRENIFSSAVVTAQYLKETFPPGSRIYVIGEIGVKSAIADAGFTVLDSGGEPSEVAAVVAGLDRSLAFDKLKVAMRLIRYGGAAFIATNPDKTFPTPDGLVPGAGMTVAALEATTDQKPAMMGKPAPTIYRLALQQLGGTPATTAMLGDRLDTDIAGARPLGLGTILVLTGVSTRAEAERGEVRPDLILEDIGALADALERVLA